MQLYEAVKLVGFPLLKRGVKFVYHDLKIAKAIFRRAFSFQQSIIAVHKGEAHHPDHIYAIFLLWQPKRFSWSVENALTGLNAVGVNVVVVINHRLSDDRLDYLKRHSRFIVVRDNTGLDMGGGYRDATLFLYEKGIKPKKIIYMNDSVFFFIEGLKEFFMRMINSNSDIIASFENEEYNCHIQSFCFAVSGELFSNKFYKNFWKKYLPVNSRLWAINHGEIGFSREVLPVARSVEVIYHREKLKQEFDRLPATDLAQLNRYFPKPIRFAPSRLQEVEEKEVVDLFISNIAVRSQIHTGAFFYRRFMCCPLMKRDLVYRRQFSLSEIEELLMETGHEDHLQSIIAEFAEKGSGYDLPFLKKARLSVGLL